MKINELKKKGINFANNMKVIEKECNGVSELNDIAKPFETNKKLFEDLNLIAKHLRDYNEQKKMTNDHVCNAIKGLRTFAFAHSSSKCTTKERCQ